MTSAMTLWTEQCCALQWLDDLNSGLRRKLSGLVSVVGLSERLIQIVKWSIVHCIHCIHCIWQKNSLLACLLTLQYTFVHKQWHS